MNMAVNQGLQVNVLMDGATRTLSLFTGMFKPSETSQMITTTDIYSLYLFLNGSAIKEE